MISRPLNAGLLPPDYDAMADQFAGNRDPNVLTLETATDEAEWFAGKHKVGVNHSLAHALVCRAVNGQ